MTLASIPKFDHDKVPILAKHLSYNDDIRLGCFAPSKLVRGDTQKRGASPAITDPLSYTDRITRAVSAEFPLGVDIPLPEEVTCSLDWIASAPPEVVAKFWADQLDKLSTLVTDCSGHQGIWNDSIPEPLRKAGGESKGWPFAN